MIQANQLYIVAIFFLIKVRTTSCHVSQGLAINHWTFLTYVCILDNYCGRQNCHNGNTKMYFNNVIVNQIIKVIFLDFFLVTRRNPAVISLFVGKKGLLFFNQLACSKK